MRFTVASDDGLEVDFECADTLVSRWVCSEILAGTTYPWGPFVPDVQVILDVGANCGAASVYFARHCPDARPRVRTGNRAAGDPRPECGGLSERVGPSVRVVLGRPDRCALQGRRGLDHLLDLRSQRECRGERARRPALVEAFAESGIRDAVKDYFNERPAMIANKWGLRRTAPGEARCPDFHQDGAYLGEGIRTVDGWISLSHCGPGAAVPAIDFLARRWRPVPWSLAEATVRAAARGAPIASPVFGPKDALFFDERLVHRTAVGPNIQAHSAIESWFVAPSSYPDKARSDRALAVSHARLVMRPTAGRGSVAESVSDRLRPSNPFGALCNTITQSVRAFPGKRRD